MFPLFYLGNIAYFKALLDAESLVFDQHEHFIKQSFRSRCEIYSSQGRLNLSVPVHRKNHMPYKEVQIDYSSKWAKEHIQAIKSAYAASPYFIDYSEDIFAIILSRPKYLIDLNLRLTQHVFSLLSVEKQSAFSLDFVPYTPDDLRLILSPKHKHTIVYQSYTQVFEQEHGFEANLSIIDLLFNEGPMAYVYLDGLN